MLRAVTVTNFKGESMRMELSKPEDTGMIIYNITGIGSSMANINTTDMATMDGAKFNSARAQTRNIVFTIAFTQQTGVPSDPDSYIPGIGTTSGSREELEALKKRVTAIELKMPRPLTEEEVLDIIAGGGLDVKRD